MREPEGETTNPHPCARARPVQSAVCPAVPRLSSLVGRRARRVRVPEDARRPSSFPTTSTGIFPSRPRSFTSSTKPRRCGRRRSDGAPTRSTCEIRPRRSRIAPRRDAIRRSVS
jgi:hypothetical protein